VISKDFGHLAYGYVVTSHASQGKSVRQVFVGQSSESYPAASREQFYVSVSRGKQKATIYTDSKAGVLAGVNQTNDRMTATELFAGRGLRSRVAAIQRMTHLPEAAVPGRSEHQQPERELIYDR